MIFVYNATGMEAMVNAFGIIFSDSYDNNKLSELSDCRTMAAIPFGGRYRLIDFIMSSMVKAKVHDVGVVTTNRYASLMEHLGWGSDWDLNRKNGGLKILTPFATDAGNRPINNKFDILNSITGYLDRRLQEYCVLSDGNLVINIDLEDVLNAHIENGADITVVYRQAPPISGNLSFSIDDNGRINDAILHSRNDNEDHNTAINVFIMSRHLLRQLIDRGVTYGWEDINRDIIVKNLDTLRIFGYKHEGYCTVVRNLQEYFMANMLLLQPEARTALFGSDTRVLTRIMDSVPSKYGEDSIVRNSFIADGCTIDGFVENSIIFRDVKIEPGSQVKNSVIMQGSVIEKNSRLSCVVVDKNAVVSSYNTLSGSEKMPYVIQKGRAV